MDIPKLSFGKPYYLKDNIIGIKVCNSRYLPEKEYYLHLRVSLNGSLSFESFEEKL